MSQIQEYVQTQKELLALEREAELAELQSTSDTKLTALEKSGLAITRLYLTSASTSATGRQTLVLRTRGRRIAPARISTGDLVGVRPHAQGALVEGVVTALDDMSVSVAVDEVDDWENVAVFVVKIGSDVTYRRAIKGLRRLEEAWEDGRHCAHSVVQVLFGVREPRFAEGDVVGEEVVPGELWRGLNERQREAVVGALRAKDVFVVHGPPGTGKTHTLVAYVCAEVARGNRVLVLAPSNVAVDNMAERLVGLVKFVRLGHSARMIGSVVEFGVEMMVMKTEQMRLAREVREEIEGIEGRLGKVGKEERKGLRGELRVLRKEMRRREKLAVRRLIEGMDVVLSTALEGGVWGGVLGGGKVVLGGDPFQLGGVVKCVEAGERGLGKSVLDRVFESKLECVVMLEVQYRMNERISNWSSGEFYGGRLVPSEEVARQRVVDLEGWRGEEEDLVEPFIVIDTAGGDCEEEQLASGVGEAEGGGSRSNKGEAEIVRRVVNQFVACGVLQKDLAVISPYAGQVELLRQIVWTEHSRALEVATIDSFQGREKEVVVMSLVRSNEKGEVGFLNDDRRTNVAITRARRCVVVVCDSETVSQHPLLDRMIQYAEEFGHYRSAVVDFPDVVGTFSQQRRPKEAIEAEQKAAESAAPRKRKESNRKPNDRVDSRGRRDADVKRFVEEPEHVAVDLKGMLRAEIEAFVENAAVHSKTFSMDLSSLGRRLVHELADEFSLHHQTRQIGKARQITIWKMGSANADTEGESVALHKEDTNDKQLTRAGANPGRFEMLDDEGGSEHDSVDDAQQVDESHDHMKMSESQNNSTEKEDTQPGGYKDINSLLREVSKDREARKAAEVATQMPQQPAAASSSRGGRGKRKGRGKNRNKDRDSDDDFDAVLAKYGANQEPSGGAGKKKDLVQQIIDGKLQAPARPPKVNKEAKQRLAAKLSKEAEKRARKTKK